MKIFSVKQVREADAFTIQNEPVSSIDLMERAAQACVEWITGRYDTSCRFKIICGTGNNGGDGLAIARLLMMMHYTVDIFVIHPSAAASPDFTGNYNRIKPFIEKSCSMQDIDSVDAFRASFIFDHPPVIIDAMFGSGLNRPLQGLFAEVVAAINNSPGTVIAIDIPSGLYSDGLNHSADAVVRAAYTLSFQFPKLSFMLPETAEFVGTFIVLDIGLDVRYINDAESPYYFITKNDAASFLKKRNKISHKGNFGHSLIVAGSYGKTGAAVLAARACLRSGTGLLTVHVPQCGYVIMQTAVPEAMVIADKEMNSISDTIALEKYNAIGVGPGIGTGKKTQDFLKWLIQNAHVPLVFDADAINILSENKAWFSCVPAASIFTPHPGEFERMAGKPSNSLERLGMQREFSMRYSVYIILKGSHTSISCPDGSVFFNSTGNPGMAKGGSGDVLTGIITALIAQNYSHKEACILGVYIHGLAGDLALDDVSEESMLPSDLIAHLPGAFNLLRNNI